MELRRAAGSLMVVGVGGEELTGLERAWLGTVRPAGIILFRRNIQEASQCRSLLEQASGYCGPHALRLVDLEGGTVDRLRNALAPMPSAQTVAEAARARGTAELASRHGRLIGRAVQAFGFNTTLAPVLDLGLEISSSVMGTRTAGRTAAEVAGYAQPFFAALRGESVTGCGKHFPGLGGGTLDSHLATPSIDRSYRQMWAEDLAVYRALGSSLPMVMISHAAFPRTRSGATPASVSRFWIETVLRQRLGYKGLVFSDDLEMGGILKHASIEQAAVEAVRAGMELIEICHSPELVLRAWEALLVEAERKRGFRELLLARARRVQAWRRRQFPAPVGRALTARQLEKLRSEIERFAAIVEELQPATNTKETPR